MKIGVPIEIKVHEGRVGLTPIHASSYVKAGYEVFIQHNAGVMASFDDASYEAVGCKILPTIEEVYATCDMIIKVKEPLEAEYSLMRENQVLYTYFHLAADKALTDAVIASKCIAIAYETIKDANGGLPCVKPLSEIAGRLSIQEGAKYLESHYGGRGLLLGGVPGVKAGNVVVIGAGIVGSNAVAMAVGMHANVSVIDINIDALTKLDNQYQGRINTIHSNDFAIAEALKEADLVISSVLIPGAQAPKLVKKSYLSTMKKGAVIVDVAIDQGGTTETSKVTYHNEPIYTVDGVIHYCVGNMPGAVPLTSTLALNNSTLAYGLKIAKDCEQALLADKGLMLGLNAYKGALTCKPVAEAYGMNYTDPYTIVK